MKTDKFENTIRQKLESISPDFQESDWTKMQGFMQVHTPPTFWQQYGSWLGYAAAASVTTVMAFMYVDQASQNNALRSDVKSLQNQIAVIREKPEQIVKTTDTVYVVRNQIIHVPVRENDEIAESIEETAPVFRNDDENQPALAESKSDKSPEIQEDTKSTHTASQENPLRSVKKQSGNQAGIQTSAEFADAGRVQYPTGKNVSDPVTIPGKSKLNTASQSAENTQYKSFTRTPSNAIAGVRTLGKQFEALSVKEPLMTDLMANKMEMALTGRLSPKQVRKTWLATTANTYKAATSEKKVEQATQAENVIPKLNIKTPYRFGASYEGQKNIQTKTVVGEILLSKRFSVSAGFSWLKVKQMEFFTEKMFRDKNNQDFKKAHPNEVPKAFVVTNIRVEPTLTQIPLTLAFRNDLKDNWTYYVSGGANITVKSKEKISYNCIVPNPREQFLSQSFERKMDISPINSVNFSLGVEKSWHPIVVQAEGFVYTYFKPLTPMTHRTGPGFKVKLLYQIGKKM